MTATTPPPLPTDTERREQGLDQSSSTRPWVKIILAVALAAGAVLWCYALFGPRSSPPGTMDDPAFGLAAQPICIASETAVDALPQAQETPDPDDRAEVIEVANGLLAERVAALDALVPLTAAGSEDRRRVEEWLTDWRTYLQDRAEYAEELQTDRDARFRETIKGGDHMSEALEGFAIKNAMPSCAPTGDVG